MSYHDLEIYQISKDLAVDIHKMTMQFPEYEMIEEGSQLRRASKSIVSNIVEGFGRKGYKREFNRFLIFAIASCDEVKAHLELCYKIGHINKNKFKSLDSKYTQLRI